MNLIFLGIILLLLLIFIQSTIIWMKNKELKVLEEVHKELLFSHRSKVVKHGKSFEQLFPYMSSYPYDPQNFRFLGSPIDGISFEKDELVFIEFKTGKSQLSEKQKKIRDLINSKKVKWKEIREK
ncbi:hypothetical protein HN992_03060 [Candidatus Woesearchaeota archaeon]|jgi:predicted Holliday junction resolvase-like endonuclease|nr:hypothetical protein [Candidatus Woesearchaeota archaeon]MBT3438765.1 hypothetical protein [Candidatus Woesearchaeota archaeon]MBT4058462.1 hypothetical protein [Candidatus Woesearchaeota archaeon]MBT4208749.1 hypothetical protein [Candidatus Woesearchaeota archaeon]MBT4733162.1 hypothetical protein [Candidatus Woesearchaeota archaeon]